MSQLYFIKDWANLFETNETRKLAKLRWWPKPNKHDGLGFRKMAAEKDCCELYAAWNLIADLASKTTPAPRRGYLERDGVPLSAGDMALSAGFPAKVFSRALSFFSSADIQWLCVESAGSPGNNPGDAGTIPAEGRKEGIEGTESGIPASPVIFSSKKDVDAFDLFPELNNEVFKEAWEMWHQHLKQKKKPATLMARERQLAKLAGMGSKKAIETLNHCIEQNWQGIYERASTPPKKSGGFAP